MPPIKDAYALALQYQLEQSEWWPEERLRFHQLRRVQAVLDHAARTVPYYRGRLRAVAGMAPGALTIEAFRRLPLLRRQDIQEAGDAFISSAVPKSHGRSFRGRTSGSTGRPVSFRGTDVTDLFTTAISLRGDLWHKRDFTAKKVSILTAKEPDERVLKWSPVPATGPLIRLDVARPISELYDEVLREEPGYLVTHPNVLMAMIERSQEIGAKPGNLLAALTFGERVEPDLRDAAREHWNAAITDGYSATEVGPIAVQCPETANLHVMSENVLVEVLDDDGRPCGPGEVGRVVLTSLHNFATPFIRYEIGDYAEVAGPCACGRGLPLIHQIVGRERELLVYPSGERAFPKLRLGKLSAVAPFRQYQITQKTVDRIEIKLVVPRPLTGEEEDALRKALTEHLDHPFGYEFVYVDDIPRAENGKFFEFRSEVAAPPQV